MERRNTEEREIALSAPVIRSLLWAKWICRSR